MRDLKLTPPGRRSLRILCLGAHADDIEIGCGGILLQLAGMMRTECRWVVFSGNPIRQAEARVAASLFLRRAWKWDLQLHAYRDGYFPAEYADIKDSFEALKPEFNPDIVFTHYRGDRHQDHRVISDLTWNTFRDHLVLEYEIPKFDGDLGIPNVYTPVPASIARRKIGYLTRAYSSQRSKRWFTASTFLGLMRLRGVESVSRSGLAEAFFGRKVVLSL